MDRVIFACRHNAGRSQMAAAFFNQAADPARARANDAGRQLEGDLYILELAAKPGRDTLTPQASFVATPF